MLYALFEAATKDPSTVADAASAAGAQVIRAKQGQTIFHEGDPSDAVYLLVEGEARAFVSPSMRIESRTTQLFRAPAVLGDRDVLAGCPAKESAVLLTAGRLVSIDADAFRSDLRADRRLESLILTDLAERHARALTLFTLGLASTRDLLAAVLADLSLRGSPGRVSNADLAAITGAAAKTIHRALAELRSDETKSDETEALPAVFHSLRSPSARE